MIIDAHCHLWRRWPYDKKPGDRSDRRTRGALLRQMDLNQVERAIVVCARIGNGAGGDGWANDDNNDYVASWAARYPDRLTVFPDVDSHWCPEYHTPGADQRLTKVLDATGAPGFTHYLAAENDGWLVSDEGLDFFRVAAERASIVSLSASGPWLNDVRMLSIAHPRLQIVLHHMGLPRLGPEGHASEDLDALVRLGARDNISVKVSGFRYNDSSVAPPFSQAEQLFGLLVETFGVHRLLWGSDYPVSGGDIGYGASLDLVQSHPKLPPSSKRLLLGENVRRLLATR